MAGTIDALNKELAALKVDDQTKIKQQAEFTPVASLSAMLAQNFRAVGSEEAAVDGRSALAKSKPKESQSTGERGGRLPIPFLNDMIFGTGGEQ